MKLLGPQDYTVQPWKNGLGSTTELASAPLPDGMPGFLWRLSIADVSADGAFSIFPEVDRVITVIEGAGMTLDAGTEGMHDLVPFCPFAFPGEWPINGILRAGPVRDFNLMIDRRFGHGKVACHDLADGCLTLPSGGALCFIHLLTGRAIGATAEMTGQQTLLLDIVGPEVIFAGEGRALYGEITLKKEWSLDGCVEGESHG